MESNCMESNVNKYINNYMKNLKCELQFDKESLYKLGENVF
jgi:hypothetical protein